MVAPGRRLVWLIVVPLLAVAVVGPLAAWIIRSFLAGPALSPYDTPTRLASVAVPHQPSALEWSADGAYLAGAAWGWWPAGEESGPSEVYVVDVAKASVAATLKVTGRAQALAFSPDGRWLAVAAARAYLVCEPASHYYAVMTRSAWMPVLIGERI